MFLLFHISKYLSCPLRLRPHLLLSPSRYVFLSTVLRCQILPLSSISLLSVDQGTLCRLESEALIRISMGGRGIQPDIVETTTRLGVITRCQKSVEKSFHDYHLFPFHSVPPTFRLKRIESLFHRVVSCPETSGLLPGEFRTVSTHIQRLIIF